MGFLPSYGSNLIEYYYGSIKSKTVPVVPFMAKSNITITQIEDYLCNNKMNMTFESIPFRIVNETHSIAFNHTIYDMECKAFEIESKDTYTQVVIHHRFSKGGIKPKEVLNPMPANLDLNAYGNDGLMPLVFNRTETNQ